MSKSANTLLEGIKRRVTMPANQVLLSDADILALCDSVIESRLVPLLMSLNQNYFVAMSSVPTVVNQSAYAIPYRAIGRTLRDVKLRDLSGSVCDLVLVALEDAHQWSHGTSRGFYFMGDKIYLVPSPQVSTSYIDMYYHFMPSKLVRLDAAGAVTGFTATTVTLASVPTTITTGVSVDFIAGKSGSSTLGFDGVVTNISGTTLTFAAGVIPSDLAVGDYVSLATYSPFVQLPDECAPYLETCAGRRALQAIGDYEGYKAMEGDEADEMKSLKIMLEPRIKGESTKIISRQGLLRGYRGWQYRRVL